MPRELPGANVDAQPALEVCAIRVRRARQTFGNRRLKRSGGVAGKLRLRDVGIGAPLRQELAVAPALDDSAAVEDADFIGLGHRRPPGRAVQSRASFAQSAESFLYIPL